MKLSEAIRLGSMLHPQNFGRLARYRDARGRFAGDDPNGTTVATTCALGAAKAAGFDITSRSLIDGEAHCPLCGMPGNLSGVVIHLNDGHHWTRERIADWVATLEAQEPSATVDAASPPLDHLSVADA